MSTNAKDWEWWIEPWKGLITCGVCGGLMNVQAACPVCGQGYRNEPQQPIELCSHGEVIQVRPAFAGAMSWSDYVLLRLMYEEWQRPLATPRRFAGIPAQTQPSSRVLIVILFWTFFESLMQRLFEAALKSLPNTISRDLLRRYSSIGSRMDQLYHITFESTLKTDLTNLGHSELWQHLTNVQKKRNAFIHGQPESINEETVNTTVMHLPAVQYAWIDLFNSRCAKKKIS
jgi:hypothetical protein